jgi:hypothetical protein
MCFIIEYCRSYFHAVNANCCNPLDHVFSFHLTSIRNYNIQQQSIVSVDGVATPNGSVVWNGTDCIPLSITRACLCHHRHHYHHPTMVSTNPFNIPNEYLIYTILGALAVVESIIISAVFIMMCGIPSHSFCFLRKFKSVVIWSDCVATAWGMRSSDSMALPMLPEKDILQRYLPSKHKKTVREDIPRLHQSQPQHRPTPQQLIKTIDGISDNNK